MSDRNVVVAGQHLKREQWNDSGASGAVNIPAVSPIFLVLRAAVAGGF